MDPKPKLARRPVERRSCEDKVGYECEGRREQSVERHHDRHQRKVADPTAYKWRLILVFGKYEFQERHAKEEWNEGTTTQQNVEYPVTVSVHGCRTDAALVAMQALDCGDA